MADEPSEPPPKKKQPVSAEEVLRQILYRSGRTPSSILTESLGQGLRGESAGDEPLAEPVVVGDESGAGAKGEIAGGSQEKKRSAGRSKQGRAALHGANRSVKVYRIIEAELDRLGELGRDESAAWGRAAFCLGLLVNVVLGLLLANGLDKATKTAAAVIGVGAAAAGILFYLDARKKAKSGQTELERIKDAHDFEDA